MKIDLYELQQMMGAMANDAEAVAMAEILEERGFDDPQEVPEREWFALVREAVCRSGGTP